MARIRTIKPDFFKNDSIAELPAMTRLLFIGLWTQADREGRLEDRPKRLKAELFPYDNCDVNKGLTELENAGFIIRYKVNANISDRILAPEQTTTELALIQVVNFLKHQQPNVKEQQSTLEAPYKYGASITGKEGKGKEQEQERKGSDISHAPENFDSISFEIKNSQRWIEDNARFFSKKIEFINEKLDEFLTLIKLKDDYHKGFKEIKSHFISWLKIQIEKEKSSAKKENNNEQFTSKTATTINNAHAILERRGIDPNKFIQESNNS